MYVMAYTTCASRKEAARIAEAIVREKLVACVNYFPVESVYRWCGKLEKTREYVLLCKTMKKNLRTLEKRIKDLHSYECPAFIVYPSSYGSKEYLSWIKDSTR